MIVQILTKDNQTTISSTLESIASLNAQIKIGDYGSQDGTLDICRKFGAQITNIKGLSRCEARNKLIEPKSINLWLNPRESMIAGHASLSSFKGHAAYSLIVQSGMISHEIRVWNGSSKFVNPVYETLDVKTALDSQIQIYSKGHSDPDANEAIEEWKTNEPLSTEPYYFKACQLFSNKQYDEFLNISNQYLFMEKDGASALMIRYYYAMVLLYHKKEVKSTLQNLNLCLCQKPLMAEFWCLMGDVYYHLLNRFDHAKDFYENAIFMGSKRLKSDRMPMEIEKYHRYPTKMIQSCNEILTSMAL